MTPAYPPPGTNGRDSDDTAASLALYRIILDNVADVVVRGDRSLKRSYVSPAVRDMLGYEPAELLGGCGFALVHPDDRGRVEATIRKLDPANPLLALTFRMCRKDGSFVWVEGRYRHIPEDNGVLAVLRDITARKSAEDALADANERLAEANLILQALANQDGLTGLANRRCFDARLAEEVARSMRHGVPLGLVMTDIDSFKRFNDQYGHLAGDDCLRRVAVAVGAAPHRPGDLAARYGGEEIAVLLPGIDKAGVARLAEKMRANVEALRIAHAGTEAGLVTISAGASVLGTPAPPDAPLALVAAADRALYQAKIGGRNRVRVSLPVPAG
jgi:diguanylate cyclase (GGDEF)-like protein/PAS domain S-box-containing protein